MVFFPELVVALYPSPAFAWSGFLRFQTIEQAGI
jgi:hypothetical protein